MSAPVIYLLKYPLELKSATGDVLEVVAELKLRRLKGRDMRAIDGAKGNGSMLLAMLAPSADVPPSTVDAMDAQDVTDAGALVAGFLGGSLLTGAP